MLLDVSLWVILIVALAVVTYVVTRIVLARLVVPVRERSRPTWAVPVQRRRLPMLTALLAAVAVLGLALGPLADLFPRLGEPLHMLHPAVCIGLLAFLLATAAAIGQAVYDQKPLARQAPLTGLFQFVEVAILLVAFS
jgi:hypothetical protein